jgi:outer membrane protein TolC
MHLLLALLAAATAAEMQAPVTFDEALGLAARAPAVAGAEEAAAVHKDLAGRVSPLTANPVLLLQPGAGWGQGGSPLGFQGEATLLQGWNLAGLPGARAESVRSETEVLLAEARAVALSHRLAAAQAWIELWAAQQALADAKQEAEIAGDFAMRVARAAEVAALTRSDAADARTYLAEAKLLVLQVEGETVDLGFALAREMGRAAATPYVAAGALPAPPLPSRTDWPELVAAAQKLPAVRARQLTARADRSRELEARAARGFVLGTGVKATRDYASATYLQAVLDFNLPLFDLGERERAPYAAAAARGEGESAEASARAATDLARGLHEEEHAREVLDELEKNLVPAASDAARLREAAMRAGDATVLDVLLVRRAFAAARARRTRAEAAAAWARVKLWLLLSDLASPGGKP